MKVLGADSIILGTRKLWQMFPIKQKSYACHGSFFDDQNVSTLVNFWDSYRVTDNAQSIWILVTIIPKFDQIETLHSSFKPTAFEPTRAQKPSWTTTANSLFLGYGQSLQLWASIFATTKCKPHGNLQFKFFLLSILMLTCLASSEARPDVSFRWSQQSLQPGSYFRLFGLLWIACLQQLQYV